MSLAPAKQPRPALEAVFVEHYAFVRERLRGLGVAGADLEDATQDVFEVLVRRIADHDPQRPMRAWMAGMARKVARRYRDRGRRGIVSLDERRIAVEDSPEDRAARAEAWKVLQRFVDELEPERWSVFVLSEIEGLRGSEIAAELGVNLNTVYARLRSARQAFERTLRRHRARERRGLAAVFVWPRRRWALWGGVTLSGGLMLSATVVSCEADERALAFSKPRHAASPSAAPPTSEPPSVPMLASDVTSTEDDERWVPSGSGFSMSSNSNGERYTSSTETRHRLDGDRVILEITYIGDDDVHIDNAGHQLALDGLEVIDGASEWALEIPAGETRVVTTTLRAAREGVVRLRATMASEGGSSSRRFAWVHEHGVLRRCDEHECEAPIGEEQLSGNRITVHVHNQCEVTKELVLFAGYPDVRPSDSIAVLSLEPDERRTMEIDAAQWFLHVHPDGRVGGGVQTSTDGARVWFSGSGDACTNASTAGPGVPPPAVRD